EPAEAEFRKTIQLQPKFGRAWWGLARVFDCSSLHGVARRFFTRAHDLDPQDGEILWSYARTLTGAERTAVLETSLEHADPAAGLMALNGLRNRIEIDKKMEARHLDRLVSPYDRAQIHLEPLLNGMTQMSGFGLKVRINDAKPVTLLLDTGASGILLGTKAAERAGLSRLGDAQIGGIGDGGWQKGYAALAGRVRIGSVELADVVVRVGERKGVADRDEDGLIGADVFSRFLVTLDFTGRRLRLEPLAGPGGEREDAFTDRVVTPQLKTFTPVYRIGHHL
ncbi:MAG: aspartyl protease family protein, partial [Bryobacteraceae bacterium]